jgi:glucose-1-phosphate thymidylyltransferase
LKVASPDEIAFRLGYLSAADLERIIARNYAKNDYGSYLRSVLAEAQSELAPAAS